MKHLRLECIDEPERFAAVATEWNSLLAESAERVPTMSHSWLTAWWQAFELDNRSCGTLHDFMLGYRKDAAETSPGLVLKEFTLRCLIEAHGDRGEAVEYNLMGTSEPYKRNCAETELVHVGSLVSHPMLSNRASHAWRASLQPPLCARSPGLVTPGNRLLGRGA